VQQQQQKQKKNKEAIDDGQGEEENGAYDKNVQCKHW
jgi:hypothetical protein